MLLEQGMEELKTDSAGRLLERQAVPVREVFDIELPVFAGEAELSGLSPDQLGLPFRFNGTQAMIDVGDDKIEQENLTAGVQQMEEDHESTPPDTPMIRRSPRSIR